MYFCLSLLYRYIIMVEGILFSLIEHEKKGEKMTTTKERVPRLIEYVKGIENNMNGGQLYKTYKEDLEAVKPQEAFEVFHSLLQEGTEPKEILKFLDKVINVFYKSLSTYQWEKPKNDNFLTDLRLENEALIERIDTMKNILKDKSIDIDKKRMKLLSRIEELAEIKHHYSKKENILFPYLEKRMEKFEGLRIMWALHDEVKKQIQEAIRVLKNPESKEKDLNTVIGNLFFGILGVVKKEELILFPSASEVLDHQEWYEMHKQSLEYEYSFIQRKSISSEEMQDNLYSIDEEDRGDLVLKTETGELNFEQIVMILNALPVDLTFVDENNKVRYFTRPKDRIFPRSPAIIGRDVENCHPPDSVHIVNEIVESFRSGKKDTAKFWINLKGRKIFIQYFALRNPKGEYRGVLEVTQDITEVQNLQGQRKLLDWD